MVNIKDVFRFVRPLQCFLFAIGACKAQSECDAFRVNVEFIGNSLVANTTIEIENRGDTLEYLLEALPDCNCVKILGLPAEIPPAGRIGLTAIVTRDSKVFPDREFSVLIKGSNCVYQRTLRVLYTPSRLWEIDLLPTGVNTLRQEQPISIRFCHREGHVGDNNRIRSISCDQSWVNFATSKETTDFQVTVSLGVDAPSGWHDTFLNVTTSSTDEPTFRIPLHIFKKRRAVLSSALTTPVSVGEPVFLSIYVDDDGTKEQLYFYSKKMRLNAKRSNIDSSSWTVAFSPDNRGLHTQEIAIFNSPIAPTGVGGHPLDIVKVIYEGK